MIEKQGDGSWRLPSVKELRTLVDVTTSNPSIDIYAFPNTPASWFWSSTQIAGGVNAWFVYFHDGQIFSPSI
ncbi:MAG: DUF1566 domain-containing protein [Myxococcaceae bacterium]|nr:DUF1566 domain-containing protein [Myxococcaceae bacterium]MBH2005795.1 DUF1566 domain-containing protein [Myxococcaceae bacterium]